MNIANFWKEQTAIWNAENKCGFCWTFGGATDRAGINRYKIRDGEECCVHVFITEETFTEQNTFANGTPFISQTNCQSTFNVWFLMPSRIDLNDHKEIPNHSEDESLEESILTPLKECVSCQLFLDMCEIQGYLFQVTQWRGSKVYRYADNNYTGWMIAVTYNELN